MRITLVGSTDLPELLPLVRGCCDFYQVTPSDRELLELSRALLADPKREGLQLARRRGLSGTGRPGCRSPSPAGR